MSTISLMRDLRFADQGQGYVGQRAERAERDRAGGLLHQRLDDEVDGVLRLERHRRLGQLRSVQACLAMYLLGGDELAHQRTDRAGEDPGLWPAGQLADLARVLLGQAQRHVAGDGGDAEHLQLGAAERQKDGDGIVLTGIGVDDDLAHWRHVNSLFVKSFWAGRGMA
jgi:hypothetical protein